MNELALFAGAGGGILGGKLLGWRTVCAVEWEPYPASVLCARQNDGLLPPFPIWDDVQTFDGKPWRGIVDVVSGGFPCQDISAAGKGAGIDGERSGMWREMARIIHEVRPRYAFVENSPMLTSRGLGAVLGDLASMGFDARWGVLGAADVGANHQRDRIWIVARNMAYSRCELRQTRESTRLDANAQVGSVSAIHNQSSGKGQIFSNSDLPQQQGGSISIGTQSQNTYACNSRWWEAEPDVGRMANGVAAGVDRLKAIGNGQVPLCAATAWKILSKDI
jgi:DNA (cytosine-5)-methyltransferase 1